MKIALSRYRKIECDDYLFPSDLYEIDGVGEYSDLKAMQKFAVNRLRQLEDRHIDLYLNTKLSTELLCAIQAAAKLERSVTIFHRDRMSGEYYPQKLRWKPVKREETTEEKSWVLCGRRHLVPEKDNIYEEIPEGRLFDFAWMDQRAKEILRPYEGQKIKVYITGLSALMISVLNTAYELSLSVEFLHYDEDTEEYFTQDMDEDIVL